MSHTRTWIFNVIYWVFLCSMIWGGWGYSSFVDIWNYWPSPFKIYNMCNIYSKLFPASQSLQDNINVRYYLLRFKFLRWNWDCKSHLNLINKRIMYVTNIRINIDKISARRDRFIANRQLSNEQMRSNILFC